MSNKKADLYLAFTKQVAALTSQHRGDSGLDTGYVYRIPSLNGLYRYDPILLSDQ